MKNTELKMNPDKSDIFEANLITMGSLLFTHTNLLQSSGMDINTTKMTWLSQIINVQQVNDQALILLITLVNENKLEIPNKEILGYYINFIGNSLVDVAIDEDLRQKLVMVLGKLNQQFGQQIVNEIWATLSLEARAEFKDVINPPKN